MEIVYSAPETAHILRLELGPIRAWSDSLNDMRRGRASVNGYVLKPIVKVHDGYHWRPTYLQDDVWRFIGKVRAANPDAKPGRLPYQMGVELTPEDKRYRALRKVSVVTHWPVAA